MKTSPLRSPLPRQPIIGVDDVGWWPETIDEVCQIRDLIFRDDALLCIAQGIHVPNLPTLPHGVRLAHIGPCGVRQEDGTYLPRLAFFAVPDEALGMPSNDLAHREPVAGRRLRARRRFRLAREADALTASSTRADGPSRGTSTRATRSKLAAVDRNLVTVSEFAAVVGVAESSVHALIGLGLPSFKSAKIGRRIKQAQALAWLEADGARRSRAAKRIAKKPPKKGGADV